MVENELILLASRIMISSLYHIRDFEGIGKLPGFKIIERRDVANDRRERYDCLYYVMQGDLAKIDAWNDRSGDGITPRGYEYVDEGKLGDIVEYVYHDISTLEYCHVGLYLGDDRVRSKFGSGYVYEHPLWAVPNCYGNYQTFYRRLNEE